MQDLFKAIRGENTDESQPPPLQEGNKTSQPEPESFENKTEVASVATIVTGTTSDEKTLPSTSATEPTSNETTLPPATANEHITEEKPLPSASTTEPTTTENEQAPPSKEEGDVAVAEEVLMEEEEIDPATLGVQSQSLAAGVFDDLEGVDENLDDSFIEEEIVEDGTFGAYDEEEIIEVDATDGIIGDAELENILSEAEEIMREQEEIPLDHAYISEEGDEPVHPNNTNKNVPEDTGLDKEEEGEEEIEYHLEENMPIEDILMMNNDDASQLSHGTEDVKMPPLQNRSDTATYKSTQSTASEAALRASDKVLGQASEPSRQSSRKAAFMAPVPLPVAETATSELNKDDISPRDYIRKPENRPPPKLGDPSGPVRTESSYRANEDPKRVHEVKAPVSGAISSNHNKSKVAPKGDDDVNDLETGHERAKIADAAPTTDTSNNRLTWIIAAVIGIVILVTVLSVVLTRDNRSSTRGGDLPTDQPTDPLVPTLAPTRLAMTWEKKYPTIGGPLNSGFGSAVALDSNVLVMGANLYADGAGGFFSSVYSATQDAWVLQSPIVGEINSDFGIAIDIQGGQMVVGAPTANAEGSVNSVGAAYFYTFSATENSWNQTGPVIRGDQDILAAGGDFGTAVAIGLGDLPRIVIGAPRSALDVQTFETGRVYTFEGTGITWRSLGTASLVGNTALDWFGASVDMTQDGSRFIAGAPGAEGEGMNGYFRIYTWNGNDWSMEIQFDGENGEELGSWVVALSDLVFAVGAPVYGEGRGRIVLFELNSSGSYEQIGVVVGNPNERLGRRHTFSGGFDDEGLILVYSTAGGDVYTVGFDEGGGDISKTRVEPLSTGFSDLVVDFSLMDGLVIGAASADEVTVLEVSEPFVYIPEEKTPTSAPLSIITDAPVVASTPTATDIPTSAPVSQQDDIPAAVPQLPTSTPVFTNPDEIETPIIDLTLFPTSTPTQISIITESPTLSLDLTQGWTRVGDVVLPTVANTSGLGQSVSLSPSRLVIGAPQAQDTGVVYAYQKINGIWSEQVPGQLTGEDSNDGFGTAVAVTDRLLVIGAPRRFIEGTLTEGGAVYCYISNVGVWQKLGETIRGASNIYAANEEFGAYVAASTNGVVLVGAPGNVEQKDSNDSQGRVYVYEFDNVNTFALKQSVVALTSNVALGKAFDIANDGSNFAVGATGINSVGYVEIYQNDGTQWNPITVLRVPTDEEEGGFGSAVSFLSTTIIAVGSPTFSNGRGRVTFYEKDQTSGMYNAMSAASLVGEANGDGFGSTLAGDITSDLTPTVFVGTTTGRVQQFNLDGTSGWVSGGIVDTGFGTSVQSLGVSSQSQAMIVGGNNDAILLEKSRR